MVFVLGVEVEWYLPSSILMYTSAFTPISYNAETMPKCEKSNNKYNQLIFLKNKIERSICVGSCEFVWLHKCNDYVERSEIYMISIY